jgi:hypothetical protein
MSLRRKGSRSWNLWSKGWLNGNMIKGLGTRYMMDPELRIGKHKCMIGFLYGDPVIPAAFGDTMVQRPWGQ